MGLFKSIVGFVGGLLGVSSAKAPAIEVSKHSANEPLKIIYGKARVAPVKVFKTVARTNVPITVSNFDSKYDPLPLDNSEKTHKKQRFLHRIDVWGLGPISGLDQFWIDGDPHTASRFSAQPYFRAVNYYGAADQTAFTDLAVASKRWGSDKRGRGVAYSATRFFAHKSDAAFRGEPELQALVKGRAVYDPRLDSTQTGGSGTHRHNDPTTWAWSDNPALALLDYLTGSWGADFAISTINVPSFMTVADLCDDVVTIPTPLTNTTGVDILDWWDRYDGGFKTIGPAARFPTYRRWQGDAITTQKRMSINLAIDTKNKVVDNVRTLLKVMKAGLPFSNGLYKLVVDTTVGAPVLSFDEDDIIGGLAIQSGDRSKRLNRVTVEFKNANKDYGDDSVAWPATGGADHTAYLAEDAGEDLHQTVKIDGITEYYQAEDMAEYLVKASRAQLGCTLDLGPRACVLEAGDVIAITHPTPGWVAQWFRVRTAAIKSDLTVTVDLQEYDAAADLWSSKTNEPLQPDADKPNPWTPPPAVTGVVATPVHDIKDDGSVVSGFDVDWLDAEDTTLVDYVDVAWRKNGEPTFNKSTRQYIDAQKVRIDGLKDGVDYDFQISYRNKYGVTSGLASLTETLPSAGSTKLSGIEAGATVDSRYSSHNLAPYIASGEVNCGSYLFTVPATNLAAMGLQGGDVMAFSAWCDAEGTGTGVRPRLFFFDDSLSAVGTFDPRNELGVIQATSGSSYEWVSGWNVTIPATATSVAMFAYRGSGTGGKMKWGKINHGPRPTPYDEPSLKVGMAETEMGANKTETRTSLNTANVGTDTASNLNGRTSKFNTLGRATSVHSMPANTIAGPSTAVNIAPLSAADVGSTATITIGAHTRQTDTGAVAYNAGSLTGKAFSTTYYIYCLDATLAGGAVTYVATTNVLDLASVAGRVYLGRVTTPADGGGTTYQEPTSGGGELP